MVDLLVATVILMALILASVTLINPSAQIKKGRDTVRRSDLDQYRTALELYAAAHNMVYPIHTEISYRADTDLCPVDLLPDGYLSSCLASILSNGRFSVWIFIQLMDAIQMLKPEASTLTTKIRRILSITVMSSRKGRTGIMNTK